MNKNLGLYIHIPFCERKCNYCSFLSFPLGEDARREYVEVLKKEIRDNGKVLATDFTVDTVFIGGGTPSLLEAYQIADIMDTVRSSFNVSPEAEITIESNPNSLNHIKLATYLKAGINRLSIGMQSFDDDVLKTLGRIHSSQEAETAIKRGREAGFSNINLDLMFGIPGQTMDAWDKTLETAINLSPDHISFYSLQIEEGTKFYDDYKNERLPFLENQLTDDMYLYAVEKLKNAGYEHYEISNMSKPGKACRHNLKYWNLEDYLGIGAGASGYINGFRCENPWDLETWKQFTLAEDAAYDEVEIHMETKEEAMSVFVFTGLRLLSGVDLKAFEERFKMSFWDVYKDKIEYLQNQQSLGNLVLDENCIRLTEKGILISNDIMCEFV